MTDKLTAYRLKERFFNLCPLRTMGFVLTKGIRKPTMPTDVIGLVNIRCNNKKIGFISLVQKSDKVLRLHYHSDNKDKDMIQGRIAQNIICSIIKDNPVFFGSVSLDEKNDVVSSAITKGLYITTILHPTLIEQNNHVPNTQEIPDKNARDRHLWCSSLRVGRESTKEKDGRWG